MTVSATNIAGDGVPGNADTTDQDFALVIYNGTAAASDATDHRRQPGQPELHGDRRRKQPG